MALQVTCAQVSVGDAAALYGANSNNTTISSMEQMFSPILIRKGAAAQGAIPGFELPAGATKESGRFGNNQVGPTRNELDPYFSRIFGDDGSKWIEECDYQIMVNDGTPNEGSGDINIRKTDRSITNVSVTALRGPLILSGWGFDICDRPVPRAGAAAVFSFDEEVVNNRGKWKTGPVNLQWDEERKVWQGGPQILCGVVSGKIEAPVDPCQPTTFVVHVFRKGRDLPNGVPPGKQGGIGSCDLGETIICVNRDPSLSQVAVQGMIFVVAVRINYEWIPIWVGCPDGPSPDPLPTCSDC